MGGCNAPVREALSLPLQCHSITGGVTVKAACDCYDCWGAKGFIYLWQHRPSSGSGEPEYPSAGLPFNQQVLIYHISTRSSQSPCASKLLYKVKIYSCFCNETEVAICHYLQQPEGMGSSTGFPDTLEG